MQTLKITLYVFLLLTVNLSFGQGLKLADHSIFKEAEVLDLESMGFSETEIPSKFSLKAYAPPIREQYGGTCVGWATSYSALSIMYNIENNITDPFIKWATAFDPYYLYTLSKSIEGDNSCNEGMYISEAIEFLSTIGSKKWSIAPYLTCSDRWKKDEFFDYAEVHSVPYKTSQEDFGVIPYNNSAQYIQDTKVAISYGVPVVIGVNLTESFRPKSKVNLIDNELVGISSNGLWNPEENEESAGAHAMTIIGYDDDKFGGSFQVMNSWGEGFGDNGYVWIQYNDYVKTTVDYYWDEGEEGGYYGQAYYFMLDFDRIDFDKNPINLGENTTRIILANNRIYDGKLDTKKWIDYNSTYDGQGQLIFEDGSIYSGPFYKNKFNGSGLYFDYDEKSMYKVEYNNGEFIDSEKLGFSEEASKSSDQLRKYLNLFDPEVRINTTSDEPLNKPHDSNKSKEN